MNRNTELALLAGVSYQASRDRENRFPIPEGWSALPIINWPYGSTRFPQDNIPNRVYWQDGASGFEAAAFTQGNEIIISFAGTDFDNEKAADGRTNAALGQGQMTRQLEQAAEFVKRIQNDPANAGKTITLTGHSLGGGLAALLGVMMDVQAVTFDPAPFRAAATESNAAKLNQYLASKGLGTDAKLASYTTSGGYVPVPLGALLRLLGPIGLAAGQLADITSVVLVPINIARESNVKALAVQGEFLTGDDPTGIRNSVRIHSGDLELLTNRASDASAISLHSQALLTLLHASLKNDASSGFFDAATRYKSFLGLLSNKTIFPFQNVSRADPTPIEHILRHQFGVPASSPNGASQVTKDNMLDALGRDLLKMGTSTEGFVEFFQEGVLSAILRYYYTSVSPLATPERYTGGVLNELLKTEAGGISFKITDVELGSDTFKNWRAFSEGILGEIRTSIPQLDNPALASLVRAAVPGNERVSVATSGTLSINQNSDSLKDLALGADGADVLRTGGGADFIFAGAGADTLDGGEGNDLLIGGRGADTYQFNGNWGKDTILDGGEIGDGSGSITIDGTPLAQFKGAGKRGEYYFDMGGGQYAGLFIADDQSSSTKKTAYITKGTDQNNVITIRNFDEAVAKAGGYLGIKLDTSQKVALIQGDGKTLGADTSNYWADIDSTATALNGKESTLAERNGKTFTVSLAVAAKAGDTLTLNLSGELADGMKAILGDSTVDANGAVIELAEGQTFVSFSLVSDSEIEEDQLGSISAQYQTDSTLSSSGVGSSPVSSNIWSLTLKDTPEPSKIFLGDQRAPVAIDSQGKEYYNWAATSGRDAQGNLTGGQAEAEFADVLYGHGSQASKIEGLGGGDVLGGGNADDNIDGGEGDDLIAGGAGSDNILGGGGDDRIHSAGSAYAMYRMYPGEQWMDQTWVERRGQSVPEGSTINSRSTSWGTYAPPINGEEQNAYILWGMTQNNSQSSGDVVDGGAGDDEILGSGQADRLMGGEGVDKLIGMGGDDIMEGNAGSDLMYGDGTKKVFPDSNTQYFAYLLEAEHGSDFLDGGVGSDWLEGGGGADQLFGGEGEDRLYGDSRSDRDNFYYASPAFHGDDYLDGEGGIDFLEGNGGADTLYGGEGNDELWGDQKAKWMDETDRSDAKAWGDDYLDGEAGDDRLIGGGGNDSLFGGTGNDELEGDESDKALPDAVQGEDYLDGEDGNDVLIGGGKSDTLFGGDGNDQMRGDDKVSQLAVELHGDDYLDGEDGNDTLIGDGGSDTLLGGDGDDRMRGDDKASQLSGDAHADDYLDGEAGDDVLIGDGGSDTLLGGEGNDTLIGDDGGAQGDDALASEYHGDDYLNGEAGNDILVGDKGQDTLIGGTGNDALDGGDGDDQLFGDDGNDQLLSGDGNDTLEGGMGDDVFGVLRTDGIKRIIDDGGVDRLILTWKTSELYLTLGSLLLVNKVTGAQVHIEGFDINDPYNSLSIEEFELLDDEGNTIVLNKEEFLGLIGIDQQLATPFDDDIAGTLAPDYVDALAGDDVVAGGEAADTLLGNDGNDFLLGQNGDDRLAGGNGDDRLEGGEGNDTLNGDEGNDLLDAGEGNNVLAGGAGDDVLRSGSGNDLLEGGDGNDRLNAGDGRNQIFGGDGDDLLQAGNGNDYLDGGAGDDQIDAGEDGNNTLLGGSGIDQLSAGRGKDVLDGGEGADTMAGGAGADTYYVDDEGDVVTEAAGNADVDVVISSVTYGLSANVEDLTLVGWNDINGLGNDDANTLTGNAGNNRLEGKAGDDLLDGGQGQDTMLGGLGNDSYVVDQSGDVIVEQVAEGYDSVLTTTDYELSENIEALSQQIVTQWDYGAQLIGNASHNRITGNLAGNLIEGGAGNDVMDGQAGADTLRGGAGDDMLYGGDDALVADYYGGYAQFANDDDLFGNEGDDQLDGGSGNDRLFGGDGRDVLIGGQDRVAVDSRFVERGLLDALLESVPALSNDDYLDGGAGIDNMRGGTGDDTYIVDGEHSLNAQGGDGSVNLCDEENRFGMDRASRITWVADSITELAHQGNDTVYSSASVNLSGQEIEKMYLLETGLTGDPLADLDAQTGESRQEIYGNSGNNRIDGGSGADFMAGGLGNDRYSVDDAGDVIEEFADEGFDSIRTSLNDYSLALNLEGLVLEGTADLNGFGNAADNVLIGNSGANILHGGLGNDTLAGWRGNDALIGGEGDDVYAFSRGDGMDRIVDKQGSNRLHLSGNITVADLRLRLNGDDLVITLADDQGSLSSDSVILENWANTHVSAGETRISRITFCGGTSVVIDESMLNQAPLALDDAAQVFEDGTATTGNVLTNDTDANGDALSVANAGVLQGQYGKLTLSVDGSYTYALNNSLAQVQALRAGQTLSESFTYTATDNNLSNALTDSASLNITIIGTNDGPVVQDDVAAVSEDGIVTTTGNVLTNDRDIDIGDVLTVANEEIYQGTYGSLTLQANGSYSYVLSNSSSAVQSLRQGQQISDVFTLQTTDGIATASSSLTLNITGANDGPIVQADTAALTEDETTTATGNVLTNDRDIDTGDVLSIANAGTYQGTYGSLMLQVNGSYTYTLNNSSTAVQSLRSGQQVNDVFAVSTSDDTASASANLTITVTGNNDAPTVQADVAAVSEDGIVTATGNVLTNDSDVDSGTTFSISNAGSYQGIYGSLVLQANGSYSYSLNNASSAVQSLRFGQQVTDVFTLQTTDGIATVASSLTLNITGANDGPVVQADVAAVSEDGIVTATGNVLSNDSDVDAGTILSVSNAGTYQGTYGSLVLQANGSYSYTLNNSAIAVQSLGVGQQVQDIFQYSTTDGFVSASSQVVMTITGSNDAPTLQTAISDPSAPVNQVFVLDLPDTTFKDIDQGDILTYSVYLANGAALPTWLSFNPNGLIFSGTPPQSLAGQSLDIQITAIDRFGASAFDTFSIQVQAGDNGCIGLTLIGTSANDRLVGSACDDTLDGRQGADTMIGGAGDDLYYVDSFSASSGKGNEGLGNGEDPPPPGHDTNYNDGPGTSPGNPGNGNGNGNGNNYNNGNGNTNANGNGSNAASDIVAEYLNQGYDRVIATVSYVLPQHVEALTLGGNSSIDGTGNTLDNWLSGNSASNSLDGKEGNDLISAGAGDDALYGGADNDILEGQDGADWLEGGDGRDALFGGAGNDTLKSNTGRGFLAGGRGNDALYAGTEATEIGFNKGDSSDTLYLNGSSPITLSLGGGLSYEDVRIRRSGADLYFDFDSSKSEYLRVVGYYKLRRANRPAFTMQMLTQASGAYNPSGTDGLRDNQVEVFDATKLIKAFDSAYAANSGLRSGNAWAIMNNLLDAHLYGSNTGALGGDLAYQFGSQGSASLAAMGMAAAGSVIGDSAFVTGLQTLNRPAAQTSGPRLGV